MSLMEKIAAPASTSLMAALAAELRETLFRIEESGEASTGDIEIAHAIARIIETAGGVSQAA